MPDELTDCTSVFSNGSEYMWFQEHYCDKCTLYRNGLCRTFTAIEKARWDEKYFPYDDLMDFVSYAGKICRRFTEEKPARKHGPPKQIEGQMEMTF